MGNSKHTVYSHSLGWPASHSPVAKMEDLYQTNWDVCALCRRYDSPVAMFKGILPFGQKKPQNKVSDLKEKPWIMW